MAMKSTKKLKVRKKPKIQHASSRRRNKRTWIVAISLVLVLGATSGMLARWRTPIASSAPNVLLPTPTPTTPVLQKEYIYAGSSLVAVSDPGVTPGLATDLAVWRLSGGSATWYVVNGETSGTTSTGWGATGDVPLPADFDGDAKTDFCVYRPSTYVWYVQKSSDSATESHSWGTSGDIPAPADFDGDGHADITVFRPASTANWYVLNSAGGTTTQITLGTTSDIPAPADYDGDGKADAAVFRASNATFYIKKSSDSSTITQAFGASGDKPVAGDYDGDGKADIATWRASDATWRILNSSNSSTSSIAWGISSDITVQGDYDRDGKTDLAVFRSGTWYIRQSSLGGTMRTSYWGTAGDTPVPGPYRR